MQHEYQIYDDKNNLLHKKILNKTNTSDLDFDKNVMLVKDNFYFTFKNNYNKITILLYLFRVYRHGTGNFNLELINDSFVKVSYLDKNDISLKIEDNKNNISSNLSKIEDNENNISSNLSKIGSNKDDIASNLSKISDNENNISSNLSKINNNENNISSNLSKIGDNKNNISSNLIKINSNEDDILYNLNEINYLKNNSSKSYLKNVYNILFYDKKTQISFKDEIFYEKIFDIDAAINDFIEINFKIGLEYRDTDDRHYVKSIYEILDENDNSLYIKSVTNNDYAYFSNRLIFDENIFYNFITNVKKLNLLLNFKNYQRLELFIYIISKMIIIDWS